ncbi:MAG: putative metal-binding motif-containing protein, partial [Nitrospiraceae bacterium]
MSSGRCISTFLFAFLFIISFAFINAVYAQTCTDADGDGYGEFGDASCPNPGIDCNDNDDTVYPTAPKICDGKDNNCDGKKDFTTDEDKDNDGVPWCAGDCDDNNPNRAPNIIEAPEGSPICQNGIDDDCDNKADGADPGCQFLCFDVDGDGYGLLGGADCPVPGQIDCDDTDDTVNPGQTDDSCNGIDNNCSGTADDQYVSDAGCGTGLCFTNNIPSS